MGRIGDKYHNELKEIVIHNADLLSPSTGGNRDSLFQRISPDHLVLVFDPSANITWPREMLPVYWRKVREVTLVDGLVPRPTLCHSLQDGVVLRIVIRGKMPSLVDPKGLLRQLHDDETLADIAERAGTAIIEVADEEQRLLVESGRPILTAEESEIVKVEVKGSKWWTVELKKWDPKFDFIRWL
jgi:hypothetical protein